MSDFDNPAWIDDQLRGVPLPPGILARLREIAAFGDVELDRALCDVPVPAGLLDQLRQISSLPGSQEADRQEAASETKYAGGKSGRLLVELPEGIRPARTRPTATHSPVGWQADRFRWAGWAVAASLLAMIGGVFWVLNAREHRQHDGDVAHHNEPVRGTADSQPGAGIPTEIGQPATPNHGSDSGAGTSVATNDRPHVAPDDSHSRADGNPSVATSPLVANSQTPGTQAPNTQAPNSQPISSQGPDFSTQAADAAQQRDLVFGALTDSPRELSNYIPPFSAQGVAGPRLKEYDLAFELRYGVHPFVVPAANALLRESRVPIWTGTASYELAWRMLLARQLPTATQMHTEDFLAAMDYRLPPPSGAAVGIRAAGGPSPWGAPGLGLLQIGVQAGQLPRSPESGTNLTLLVDGSENMRPEGRWELVRRALSELSGQLLPADRLSLVVFNQQAEVWLRDANRAQLERLLSAWDRRVPSGSVDVAGAIEIGAALVGTNPHAAKSLPPSILGSGSQASNMQPSGSQRQMASRVVLLTDAAAPLVGKSLAQAKQLVKQSVMAGVPWDVVNLRQDELVDDGWKELAAIGGHGVRRASSRGDLYQRLLESLAGRPQIVAGSVSLKVEFRGDAVVRYRLIGQDATGAGGLSGGPLEADLRSGQVATALYELELAPEGPERVATVEVTWHEPGSEQLFRIKQDVSRLEFAPSWRESALPLQLATLAAETGEILRGSPFALSGNHSLDQVADLAAQANPKLAERPSFLRLKQFIELARAARQGNSAARTDAP